VGIGLVVVSIIAQVVYLLLNFLILFLAARVVLSITRQYARRWHPGRGAAATMELVWTVTDPPLKPLRRVIPPIRLGGASIDLSFLVLWIILLALSALVRRFF
jgi:YggT family protein